ncbi:hypothetical protein TUM17561_17390 [Enterobacter cloacae]|nr:hypothetical protein TUM17561_17390 [Enterobacter cloacae]
MIGKEKAMIKERKRKTLRSLAARPNNGTMKGLKGESQTLDPELLKVETFIQRNNIGTLARF